MSPTLVILAAGMGSRYGSLKQLEPLGPNGQTLLDYSIYDARRAGFHHLVFVIRRQFETAFKMRLQSSHVTRGMDVRYAFQEIRDLPASFTPPTGRDKPWGTAHAVWCLRETLHTPFAIVNADDFYGADSFRRLAEFLTPASPNAPEFALVGYRLGQTLSDHGAVSRGICRVGPDGYLTSIEEQTALVRDPETGGAIGKGSDGQEIKFSPNALVSMNCWGLTPAVYPLLETQLTTFLRGRLTDLKAECYLPSAIGKSLTIGRCRVRVLPTDARWCGVTYQEDKPTVQAVLKALHDGHEYPGDFSK